MLYGWELKRKMKRNYLDMVNGLSIRAIYMYAHGSFVQHDMLLF